MQTQTIRRQYDEVIAQNYDVDPFAVTRSSLQQATEQLQKRHLLQAAGAPLRVLDVGAGTGLFLQKLIELAGGRVKPFALDLSEKMIANARRRLPGLTAAVDDAANLDAHFPGQAFDLVCTHFIAGFVPLDVLAPKIHVRLDDGGYWSFVAGTKAGFPALQAKASAKPVQWLFGGRKLSLDDTVHSPAGRPEVVDTLARHGFAVREAATFEPEVRFQNFDDFMDFAYRGGWLTPFIEALGVHKAGKTARLMYNLFFFPVVDRHNIEIVLAQKAGR